MVDRRCAKFLVEMDIKDELYEEIKLDLSGGIWNKKMDYWKIPFRCFGCRYVGHIIRDFPLPGSSVQT